MLNVLTDIIQSSLILIWTILMIFLFRRVNQLSDRMDRCDWRVDSREIEDPQPVCGCGHHHCFHDETSCSKSETYYRMNEARESVPCGCKRYTGPEPLPTVIP